MQNRPIVWWPNSFPNGNTSLLALWHLEGMTIEPSIWATTGCYAFQALRNMLHKSIKNNSGCRNCGPYSRCRSLSRLALGNPRKNIPGNGRFTAIWKEKLQRLLRCTTVKKSPTLGGFLSALQNIDPKGGPAPGLHNFYRGGLLSTYDAETRQALKLLRHRMDIASLTRV